MLSTCLVVFVCLLLFFFKQKTAYDMRISDWSSDVCSSDLLAIPFDNFAFVAPPSNYLTTGYYGGGFINTKAVAVFGQATYEIAEDLRLTLGARYSTEKKKALDNFLRCGHSV